MEKRSKTFYMILLSAILWSLSTAGLAGQIDFGTYSRLETGMSEGEVLFRAGVPDRETYFDSEAQRTVESIKQFLYIPGPGEAIRI